jgi:isoquinoline 1-oxidoreductase beta subunit
MSAEAKRERLAYRSDERSKVSRRGFLHATSAVAGGLMVGFHVPGLARDEAATPELNAWVQVLPDETVVIRIARSEMGQGTLTGLAQLVAEELECDWARVKTEYPTPGQNLARNRAWGSMSTGGSRGVRESHEYVRKGGALARAMLIQAAANQWDVPVVSCSTALGFVQHAATGRKLSYGQLAAEAAKLAAPADIQLKDAKDWQLAGRPMKRLDTRPKLDGSLVYGMDLQLPGMLNAAIKDCPVFGGKLKSFDATEVEKLPGVKKVVKVGDSAVAVVADTWWRAKTALDALNIVWDEGPHATQSSADTAATLKAGLDAADAAVGSSQGDAKAALAAAARKVEAVYSYPHQNHATMEVMNATAKWTPERCEVWTPPRSPRACRPRPARSTSCTWAAASVGAARCTTGCARRSPSPRSCRAHRSS